MRGSRVVYDENNDDSSRQTVQDNRSPGDRRYTDRNSGRDSCRNTNSDTRHTDGDWDRGNRRGSKCHTRGGFSGGYSPRK